MNYEDIRRYQRMERNTPNLAAIDNDFYCGLAGLMKECKDKYAASSSPDDLKALENTLKTARDIFERREQKLLAKSLQCVRTGEQHDGEMPPCEGDFLKGLIKALRENRQEFEKILNGETISVKQLQNLNDIPQINGGNTAGNGEDLNNVLVRIIKKIPKFVSSDLHEYGPYDTNDIIKLPRKEAELLSGKELIEVI